MATRPFLIVTVYVNDANRLDGGAACLQLPVRKVCAVGTLVRQLAMQVCSDGS